MSQIKPAFLQAFYSSVKMTTLLTNSFDVSYARTMENMLTIKGLLSHLVEAKIVL